MDLAVSLTASPAPTCSTTEAQGFLSGLFGTIPNDSALEIRLKTPSGPPKQHFYNSIDSLTLDDVPADTRAWFGVCLRRRGTATGKAADVTWASFAWVDVDGVDPNVLLHRLRRILPPTFVVASGAGAHCYWKINQPLEVAQEGQAGYLREVVHGLGSQVGGCPVHDLSRVLGLVGSLNTKYSPPRKVHLVHADERRIYTVGDLARHRKAFTAPALRHDTPVTPAAPASSSTEPVQVDSLRIHVRMRELIKKGWSKGCGYRGRSEADEAVCVAMLSAKYTEDDITDVFSDSAHGVSAKFLEKGADGPRYLARTIEAARDWIAQQAAINTQPAIKCGDGTMKALKIETGTYRTVYTGELHPVAKISSGAENVWEVEVPGGKRVTLDAKAFASSYGLKCALPAVASWTGTDHDVQNLIPYFESFNVPHRAAVTVVGWHDDRVVFPNVVLSPGGLESEGPLIYKGELPAALTLAPDWPSLAGELPHLLDLHARPVMYGMLGWFLATFLAPQIRKLTGGPFPVLNVWGSTGAGKTTTLNLLWKLTGSTRSLLSAGGGSTAFTKTANLSGSNTLPVIYDEHRAGGGLNRLYETIREAYQASEHERGRADLRVVRLTLTAPVVVSGESALPEPALRQRSLIIRLSPQAITDTTRQTKQHVEALPLLNFAGGAYQHVRGKLERLSELWSDELARAARLGESIADDRKKFALAVPLVGLRLFDEFLPYLDMDSAATVLRHVFDGERAEEVSVVQEIVVGVLRLVQDRRIRHGVDYKTETRDGITHLFLNPTTVLGELESRFRREKSELPITSRDAIREALRIDSKRERGMVLDTRTDKKLAGRTTHTIVFNLDRVEEVMGIPVHSWSQIPDNDRWNAV